MQRVRSKGREKAVEDVELIDADLEGLALDEIDVEVDIDLYYDEEGDDEYGDF